MFEKKEVPIKIDNDTHVCEICGAILITAQEKILGRCPNHILK